MTVRASDLLTREEITQLTQLSDAQGWRAVATTWGLIAGAFAVAAVAPLWIGVPVALIVLGGRQLALAILMHEASHRSLFATRSLNDTVAKWFCAWPMWFQLEKYRAHHLQHHAHTGSARDPDLCLVEPFPTTAMGLGRKVLRDLTGIAGLRRLVGLILMDSGFITYTASGGARWLGRQGRSVGQIVVTFVRNTWGVMLANALLALLLAVTGQAWLYGLWVAAYFTSFGLFLRLRSIAEHAVTPSQDHPLTNTRTTYANWLARLTVAPHAVNYHLEHHLLMTVPYFRLRQMHEILRRKGLLEHACVAQGYVPVFRQAVTAGLKSQA